MSKQCLALDLGGTKLELAVINSKGEILSVQKHMLHLEIGKDAVLEQIVEWSRNLLRDFPNVESVGVSSCGPLDPVKGLLVDATNLLTNGKGWGVVPLRAYLSEKLGLPTYLDNDAACSALAERWLGTAFDKKTTSFMTVSLGTGLGVGIICNDQLYRAGRFMHPESGHIIVDYKDENLLCACGVKGCSEGYVSGVNFAKNFNRKHGTSFTAKDIVDLGRSGDLRAQEAFDFYADVMSVVLHNYCVLFSPEWIIFCGSFASAYDLFAPRMQEQFMQLMKRRKDIIPQFCVSHLENHACLLGAASLCFQ